MDFALIMADPAVLQRSDEIARQVLAELTSPKAIIKELDDERFKPSVIPYAIPLTYYQATPFYGYSAANCVSGT